jgi:hypothetical protein
MMHGTAAALHAPALLLGHVEAASLRDQLWNDCRNSLGIARLLVHEGRPEALVATACRLAVEGACRAALEQLGLRYDGALDQALLDLKVEAEWMASATTDVSARFLLLAAERTVGSIAVFLRDADPGRSWGF